MISDGGDWCTTVVEQRCLDPVSIQCARRLEVSANGPTEQKAAWLAGAALPPWRRNTMRSRASSRGAFPPTTSVPGSMISILSRGGCG